MRIKKDNKIEVGRRMIKRVIKKVYLKIIKSKFGRKLRENLMPHLVAYIENEDIIIENKNSNGHLFGEKLTIKSKVKMVR